MIKIGVIIPFYNGEKFLPRLINSIFIDSTGFDLRIYIVDNSRYDQRLKKNTFSSDSRIIIVNTEVGIGYGKACNIGYSLCKKNDLDYAVVLNQDGYFAKGSFVQLLSVLSEESKVCAAMSFMAEYESATIDSLFHHVYLSGNSTLLNDMGVGTIKKFYTAELLCGAAFGIKCKDIPYPYLFDELFHMYYEDIDLGRRMKYLGKTFVLVPSSIFHHKHSNKDSETQEFRELLTKKISRNKFILKDIRVRLFKKITGWFLLELKNGFIQLLNLQLKALCINLLSWIAIIVCLPQIIKSRRRDRIISSTENSYQVKKLPVTEL